MHAQQIPLYSYVEIEYRLMLIICGLHVETMWYAHVLFLCIHFVQTHVTFYIVLY